MKGLGLLVVAILTSAGAAHAKTQYLTDINAAVKIVFTFGSVNNCTACHTATGNVNPPVFNETFGKDFRANAAVVTPGRNPATPLTQGQIQTILQNIRNMDSDADSYTNEIEISQNSAPENPAITPQTVAQKPEDDQEASDEILRKIAAGKKLSEDEAYQLNSGCGKPLNVQAFYNTEHGSKTASAAGLGFLLLFSLPAGVLLFIRRTS